MTTSAPIAAIERIEKALEGADLAQRECVFAAQESRKVNGSDTYASRVLDKAAGVIAQLVALARLAEEMKREIAELRRIGSGMANVLHHWKQQSTILESDRLLMTIMQEEWDAVPAARYLAKGESDAQG